MPEQSNEQIPFNRPCTMPSSGSTAYSAALNAGDFTNHRRAVFFVDLPAIPAANLPNGATVTFSLLEGNDPTFATEIISTTALGTVTGASSTGASSVTFGTRLALVGGQYIGMKAVASASAAPTGTVNLAFARA